MRKAERLFQLTNLIRTKQPITAQRLAEELGVSTRSIYRYIDDLSISGIPIYGTTGRGYELDKKFELPPLNLTEKEFDALKLGVAMVTSWTGDELSRAAKSLSDKIETSLPDTNRKAFSSVVFAPNIQTFGLHKKSLRQSWESIHAAIKNSNQIELEYISLQEKPSSRVIYPLGLFYWGAKWTLGAWCTQRQDYRNFRLDRIRVLTIMNVTFSSTEKINLDSFITHCQN